MKGIRPMIINKIIKNAAILSIAVISAFAFTSCVKYESPPTTVPAAPAEVPNDDDLMSGKHHVEIEVENYGTIALELDADVAPITVTNFINLAESGFYDGLTFHRIMDGFMIQGGDPAGNGSGGSDQNIIGEYASNGYENNISHVRGVISMARKSNDYNSASSQFFIVQSDSTSLDGDYAGFGHVTSGLAIVDQICIDTPVQDNNGSVLPSDQPVISEVRVID